MTSYTWSGLFFIFYIRHFCGSPLFRLILSFPLCNSFFISDFMPRVKDRNPSRHYVNPALLSRRRQLRLQLLHILQHLRDEMQICRMRCRELSILYNHAYLFHYNFDSMLFPPPPVIPLPTETVEQESLTHSTSPPSDVSPPEVPSENIDGHQSDRAPTARRRLDFSVER